MLTKKKKQQRGRLLNVYLETDISKINIINYSLAILVWIFVVVFFVFGPTTIHG